MGQPVDKGPESLASAPVYRRQSPGMGGHFWDEVLMECLATEFTAPVLARHDERMGSRTPTAFRGRQR